MTEPKDMTDAELVEAVAEKMSRDMEYSLGFLIPFITDSLMHNYKAVRIVLEAALMAEREKE